MRERGERYSITITIAIGKNYFFLVYACDRYSDQILGLILRKFCTQGGRKILVESVSEQHRLNRYKIVVVF